MKKKLVAIAAAAVAMIPLIGSPANASVTGNVSFVCTANLPEFPSPASSGSCGPTSSAAGSVAGLSVGGDPYAVAIAGANNFSASFDYNEACLAGSEPPVAGQANGTATVTGITGVKGGATVTATATLKFDWDRAGVVAAVNIRADGSLLEFSDGDTAVLTVDAAAVAAFAPVLTLANTCPVGGPLQAVVAGNAVFGA